MTLRKLRRLLREQSRGPLASGQGSPLFRFGRHDMLWVMVQSVVGSLLAWWLVGYRTDSYIAALLAAAGLSPLLLLLRLRSAEERRAMMEDLYLTGMPRDDIFAGLLVRPLRLAAYSVLPWLCLLVPSIYWERKRGPGVEVAPAVLLFFAAAWIFAFLTMFRRAIVPATIVRHLLIYTFYLLYQGLVIFGMVSCLTIALSFENGDGSLMLSAILVSSTVIGLGLILKRFAYDGPELLFASIDREPLRVIRWSESELRGPEAKPALEAYGRAHGLRWIGAMVGGCALAVVVVWGMAQLAGLRPIGAGATVHLVSEKVTTKVTPGPEEDLAREVLRYLAIHGFQSTFAFSILAAAFTLLLLTRPFGSGSVPLTPGLLRAVAGRAMILGAFVFLLILTHYVASGFGTRRTKDADDIVMGAYFFSVAAPATIPAVYTVFLSLLPRRTRRRRLAFWLVAAFAVMMWSLMGLNWFTPRNFYLYEIDWPATMAPALYLLVPLLGLLAFNRQFMDQLYVEDVQGVAAPPPGEKTLVRTPADSHL